MDIISVDNPSTFPAIIREAISEKKFVLNSYFQHIGEQSDIAVRCALEHQQMYSDDDLMELVKRVQMILDNNLFEGYHNTRVMKKSALLDNGLLLLSADSYFMQIRSAMNDLGIDGSEQDDVCNKVQGYLDNKFGMRTGLLSFFAPYSLRLDYGCFTNNIGGEICEFGLSDSFPDIFNILSTNGYPVTVRFAYHFRDVADYRKDIITFEFICISLIH